MINNQRFKSSIGAGRAKRGFVALFAGTLLAQAIGIAASPLLTRVFSPFEFGAFSVVNAFALSISAAAALRLERAVPIPDDDGTARRIAVLGLASSVVTAAVGLIVLFVLREPISRWFRVDDLEPFLLWIPILSSTVAAQQVLSAIAIRDARFKTLARRNLVVAVTIVTVQIGLGLAGMGTPGLLIGAAAGQAFGALILLPGLTRMEAGPVQSRLEYAKVLSRYRSFPLVLAPSGLLNVLGLQAPVLLAGAYYGPAAAGWFGLTQRVIGLPVALVGQAAAQVFLSELARSRRDRDGQGLSIFWWTSNRMALAGSALGAVLFLAGPYMFELVFGNAWAVSGDLARALAVMTAFQLIGSTVSQTLIVHERLVTQALWDVVRLATVILSFTIAHQADLDLVAAAWIMGTTSSAMYAISWLLSRHAVARADH
ncbi:lipopolysaccharide biosynthesis protein [Nocardioides aquiterrae]|uniref:Lipopolysaccharide biosynthesis protein n=1 Tax=Nocardioides aquiterrae TaxID=203799 RepID=A0ABP4EY52_9ACTN